MADSGVLVLAVHINGLEFGNIKVLRCPTTAGRMYAANVMFTTGKGAAQSHQGVVIMSRHYLDTVGVASGVNCGASRVIAAVTTQSDAVTSYILI